MARATAILFTILAVGAAFAQEPAKVSTAHPLDPLSQDEIRATVKLLKDEKRITGHTIFSYLGLLEPPKETVLAFKRGDTIIRRAKIVGYDGRERIALEGVVNLTEKKVESWQFIKGAQPGNLGGLDFKLTERIVRTDPRWIAAIKKRKLDPVDVVIYPMPVRGYLDRKPEGSRYVLAMFGLDEPDESADIPGLMALVDLTKRTVEWIRDEPGLMTRASYEHMFDPEKIEAKRPALKPIRITQPEGTNFEIEGQLVRWQGWEFRIGNDPRTGLVLHSVAYRAGDKLRSILYRGSLSELYVPYGDPDWFMMHWFDAGEFGLGSQSHSPLKPLNDVPENATLLQAVTHGSDGRPRTVPNAIAIYERDAGILWRHGGESRRARQLVVQSMFTVGNYDYGLNWIFHQDGVIEVEVELTGLMIWKAVPRIKDSASSHVSGRPSTGLLVAPNVEAPNHQHFFSFRLDMDVDGQVKNALYEMNTAAIPNKDGNPLGHGFAMTETLFKTEKQAQRQVNAPTARSWKIVNPSVLNELGQPSAYMLMPMGNAAPYALPGSYLAGVGAFANHHLWATPYRPNELYAAGTYVFDGEPTDGLAKWTAANRSIEFEDVVIWYTLGVTHLPRIEEWPVMTVHKAGFKLMPAGFFSRNPALDVPETEPPMKDK
jgi:primary-amine oxidase